MNYLIFLNQGLAFNISLTQSFYHFVTLKFTVIAKFRQVLTQFHQISLRM